MTFLLLDSLFTRWLALCFTSSCIAARPRRRSHVSSRPRHNLALEQSMTALFCVGAPYTQLSATCRTVMILRFLTSEVSTWHFVVTELMMTCWFQDTFENWTLWMQPSLINPQLTSTFFKILTHFLSYWFPLYSNRSIMIFTFYVISFREYSFALQSENCWDWFNKK